MFVIYSFTATTNCVQAVMATYWLHDLPPKTLVRFTPLGSHSYSEPAEPATSACIAKFGLLGQGGCKLALGSGSSYSSSRGDVTLKLGGAVQLAGYYFVTLQGSEQIPVLWKVEAQESNMSSWQTIGASSWSFGFYNGLVFDSKVQYPTPIERNSYVEVYYPLDSALALTADCIISANYAHTYLWMFLCGLLRQLESIRKVAVASLFFHIGILAILSGIQLARKEYFQAQLTWVYCLQPVVFGFGILLLERQMLIVIYSYLFTVVISSIGVNALRGSPLYTPAESPNGLFRTGVLPGLLGLVIVIQILRQKVIQRARSVVLEDRAKYSEIWDQFCSDAKNTQALVHVKDLVDEITLNCQGFAARQMNICSSRSGEGLGGGLLWESVLNVSELQPDSSATARATVTAGPPTDSLDQIFYQATVLQPMLIGKVQHWALLNKGMFPVHLSPGTAPVFVSYAECVRQPRIFERIAWAKIKSVERAVEKAVRSYSQVIVEMLYVTLQIRNLEISERERELERGKGGGGYYNGNCRNT
jgi:hypothetical protein